MSLKELGTKDFWICMVAEFLATFFFVFLTTGSAITWDSSRPPTIEHISLTSGLSIATLAMLILHISGGLINPAVSVAQVVTRKISPLRGIFYIVFQVGGGIAGSAMLYGLTPSSKRGTLGATVPAAGVSTAEAFGIEFLLTFLLVLTVFACTDPKRKHYGYEVPLAIGFCVTASHLTGIRFTGCGINPARSMGPAVVMGIWTDHWIYWTGPIGGGTVAGILYQLVFRAREEQGTITNPADIVLSNITTTSNNNLNQIDHPKTIQSKDNNDV